ncbi:MAG: TonB-dependent receptor [Saprospirales bacterium]|nr:MAG: TonB-dependent receptor [Saprospirales bacterium]
MEKNLQIYDAGIRPRWVDLNVDLRTLCALSLIWMLLPLFALAGNPESEAWAVSGKVTDAETGEALVGVTIMVENTISGTITDFDGNYTIMVQSEETVLLFRFVGYAEHRVVVGNQRVINVDLGVDETSLSEVVVVGYGRAERREITGAISSIDRATIISEPIYSFENLLQGRAPGVDVTTDSYRPGAGSTIRIRGSRSLVAGNDPLIVMDGVPIEGDLMGINPADIESIEILKDASATAIYGSRGANGVILVTTQRGPLNAAVVDYRASFGVQEIANRVDLMNADRYIEMQRDAARREGTYTTDEALFLDWELEAIQRGIDTDWQDVAFGTGYQHDHHLSVRGGTLNTRYALSGTYTRHDAIVSNNDYTRYVGRLNLDQIVTPWLTAGVSSQVYYSQEHRGGNFRDLVLRSPLDWPERAEEALRSEFAVGESFPTPFLDRDYFIDQRNRTRVIANIFAEVNIVDGLSYRFNFSPDINIWERGTHNWQNSTAGVGNTTVRNMLYENIVNFRRSLGRNHTIRATGLYSFQTNREVGASVNVRGLPFEQQRFHNIGSAEETVNRNSTLQEWAMESYMLRVNYAFRDRYMFTLTGRVDGSSRLAEGNKYGLFPSAAVAWLISDEPFLQNNNLINELKFRVSYGEVGNTGIQPYQTQGKVSRVGYAFGDQSVFGFQSSELANSELRWERTRSFDVGVDFSILNHRIGGSIGVYQQNTTDLLMNRQLPPTSGFESTLENVGSTRNTGLEVGLSTVLIEPSDRHGFRWTTDFIFNTNRNEIVELYGGTNDDPGNRWFIGQPINVHYDYEFIGIWQESERELAAQYSALPGDIKLRDVNGDGGIGAADRVILGSENPSWTGSISSRMSYRNFDMSFMVYTKQGVTIWSEAGGTSLGGYINLRRGYNLNSRDIDYYTPDNPSNEFPEPRVRGHAYFTPMGYFDASFIRVRNITFGYSLPASLLDRSGLRRARVYTAVQNPFTFTDFPGLDPEGARNHDMPNYRTFLFGLEIGF